MTDYNILMERASQLRKQCPQLRKGQALMIALFKNYIDVYKKINGSPVDCFYEDSKFNDCKLKVQQYLRERVEV